METRTYEIHAIGAKDLRDLLSGAGLAFTEKPGRLLGPSAFHVTGEKSVLDRIEAQIQRNITQAGIDQQW